jgi:hypothetical protein
MMPIGDNDPMELPKDLPTHSISILYSFARGKESWSEETFRSILTIIGYVGGIPFANRLVGSNEIDSDTQQMLIRAHKALSGSVGDGQLDKEAMNVLGMILDRQDKNVAQGLIPWEIVLAWALHKLMDHLLNKVS